ncbi:MAG TPA: copper-containing nitrite reductase, partial [Pararhizobium sp.]|nr:copper-containing nitrite reductase [Pararhizobium sp.]
MLTRREALMGTAVAGAAAAFLAAVPADPAMALPAADISTLPRERVKLVAPPFVHEHRQVATGGPKVIEFQLTVQEKPMVIDDEGTVLQAMTFNGSIPGPMMVVHQDDYVELTLVNPATNVMPHNIDVHAATGAMGGADLTEVNPGEQVTFRFKATRAGVFIYHCAAPGMVPLHVVSGMSGVIMVLPRGGLRDENGKPLHYDRIFYIGESDFYIPRDRHGNYRKFDSLVDSYEETLKAMRGLIPTHVVFNGRTNALTGDNALKAKVGETVLIVHFQANRDTRLHMMGGHGDYVWQEGKFANPPDR